MSRTQKKKVSCSTVWSQNMSRAPFTLARGGVAVHFPPWVHLGSSHLGSIPALKQWKSVPAPSLLGCRTLLYRLQNYIQLPQGKKKKKTMSNQLQQDIKQALAYRSSSTHKTLMEIAHVQTWQTTCPWWPWWQSKEKEREKGDCYSVLRKENINRGRMRGFERGLTNRHVWKMRDMIQKVKKT